MGKGTNRTDNAIVHTDQKNIINIYYLSYI